ncbi:zinc-binding alcohol dehydrogenase [Paenibacillus sp. PK3_47]|uniref:zinc-binding dehydrogenase n=1 Tax=Paenibacillus sp. PK3_47 TaxID=2072642 RepID=UPI00201D8B7B|nr:zinc-binding dehydrogenase [Paenibacillus sp. PK3_47]UQZ32704.1 zinc-binding alcohol dehydrogenase [Paenibacillus sp. PK3_47]
MKALLLQEKGKWNEMKVNEMDMPSAGKGQVLVEVHAAGLNPVDYKTATGGNPNWTYPHVLGLDVAGVIAGVGEGVEQWKTGDRVLYHGNLTQGGGYAEFTVAKAHAVSRIPDGVSFEEAAALPTAGYTAYQAVCRKLPLSQVHTLLIHGGAGGVGGFAVQLAKLAGKQVISTASSHNHEYVKSLGADHVIDYREADVTAEVLRITGGRGVDAVISTVSRQTATEALEQIAFSGHVVHIAGAPDYGQIKPFTKALSIHEVALGAAHQSGDLVAEQELAAIGNEMLQLLAEGKLSSLLEEVVALEAVPDALARLSERHVRGKIVAKLK